MMDTITMAHKIHTRVVLDTEGNVLEDEFYFYDGPLALCEEGEGAGEGEGAARPKTFAEMTPEQAMSWFGHINATQTAKQVAKQFDEKVMPFIEEMRAGRKVTDVKEPSGNLQDLMFSDPEKFFEEGLKRVRTKEKNLTEVRIKAIDAAILEYAEEPLYKEIHSDMKKIATDKLGEGWPPKEAVEYGKTAAEAKYLKSQALGEEGELEMLGGGSAPARKGKVSLPPKLKAACERDIADGIVKDEADYIKNMSPRLKQIYGM